MLLPVNRLSARPTGTPAVHTNFENKNSLGIKKYMRWQHRTDWVVTTLQSLWTLRHEIVPFILNVNFIFLFLPICHLCIDMSSLYACLHPYIMFTYLYHLFEPIYIISSYSLVFFAWLCHLCILMSYFHCYVIFLYLCHIYILQYLCNFPILISSFNPYTISIFHIGPK